MDDDGGLAPWKDKIVEAAQGLRERLFRPPGWPMRFSNFEGVDYEKQALFLEHFHGVGGACEGGSLDLPATSCVPSTIWGPTGPQGMFSAILTVPEGYRVPMEMILGWHGMLWVRGARKGMRA